MCACHTGVLKVIWERNSNYIFFKKKSFTFLFVFVCLFGVFPWEHASICICVCVCMCTCWAVCALAMKWGQEITCRVRTFLLLCGFRGLNKGHQSWWQASLQAILSRRICNISSSNPELPIWISLSLYPCYNLRQSGDHHITTHLCFSLDITSRAGTLFLYK